MKLKILFFISLIFNSLCYAAHVQPERVYQTEWCNSFNGQMEYKLSDNTRVDCLTKKYAVEFDFAPKWAEAIGQSLYYGLMAHKKPAVVLIIEKPDDLRYYKRIEKVAKKKHIKLWTMKSFDYQL